MSRAVGELTQRIRAVCGYLQPGGPPRTVEEACRKARQLDRAFPRYNDLTQAQRDSIDRTLWVKWNMPTPWHGSHDDWDLLMIHLRDALDLASDEEELPFQPGGDHSTFWGEGNAIPSGADRTGGHHIDIPSHHASNPGVPGGQATPPPPYSHHPDSEHRRARRHGDGHETGRRHERRNDGASHQGHGNSQHHGQNHGGRNDEVSRGEHGSSRDHRGHNTRAVHESHGHSQRQRRRNPLASYSDPPSSDTSSGSDTSYHSNSRRQGGRNTGGLDFINPHYQRRGNYSDPSSSDSDGGVSLSTSESQSVDSFSTGSRSTDRQPRMHQQSNALTHRRPRH